MKFTKTKFQAAFEDGVLEMDGYAFDIGDRQLVVHLARPTMVPVFPYWHVSERTSGFAFSYAESRTRAEAAATAVLDLKNVSDKQWAIAIAAAIIRRDKLQPVPVLSSATEPA